MECRQIIEKLEKRFPQSYAMEWDHIGLQAGRAQKEVKKILIALDADDAAVDTAVRCKVDMMITHHPLIFKPLSRINDGDFIGRRLLRLIQHDISYYTMHTNYDVLGMANLASEMLELQNPQVLEVTDTKDSIEGIGRVADLKAPVSLMECAAWVKRVFDLPSIRVFGEREQRISRLAVAPGSGKGFIKAALEKGADVLVTGDIDHHEGIDANAQGMALIDGGHYGIEHIFIADMKRFCEENLPETEVQVMPIRHPFWSV